MIKKADISNLITVTELMKMLWEEHDNDELLSENEKLLKSNSDAVFLYFEESGKIKDHAVGFAQCSLRYEYVEGTKSSPVGYLEGIFVSKSYRKRKIASSLLTECEKWAKSMGCTEFASDCEITNNTSFSWHLNAGFEEVNRIICFKKSI
mgnify:FL=1